MMLKLKIAFAELLGFLVLLPACLLHAWGGRYPSIKPVTAGGFYRPTVSEWDWWWLNYWYANSEDGVSGAEAIVFDNTRKAWVFYTRTFPSWVPRWAIAYAWSAWRNGANNLKRPLRTDGNNTPWRP